MLLKKKPLKLSHVSIKLNFTVQETSRNITRLSDAKLIVKDVDGTFHVTPYGDEALNLLSGFKFLFKNRDYLTTHVLAGLPQMFSAGLGILDSFELANDVMVSFHNIENMIAKAEKFVWILTNQILVSTLPFLAQAIERGTEFMLLMPKDFGPSEGLRELVDNPVFALAARTRQLESRFLDKVNMFLCLSEKEAAALGFPNLDGKLDYTGFKTESVTAVEWTVALYTYYWNKATSQIPDQLLSE